MKQSNKYNRLALNANDHSFLNTKIEFTPDKFEYNQNMISYEVMEVLCDYLHKLRMDYVSRSAIKNEKIKNEEPRLKAIRKQVIDLQNMERKAQILLNWTGIKLKPGVEDPKGTKYIDRSPKSGLADGLPEEKNENN